MTRYKLSNFNDQTPKKSRGVLEQSLWSIKGVKKVVLFPELSEFTIRFRPKQDPEAGVIEAAVIKAGFRLEAQSS